MFLSDLPTSCCRGYDSNLTLERCHGLGLTDIVCAKRKTKGDTKKTKAEPNPQTHTMGLRCPTDRRPGRRPTRHDDPLHPQVAHRTADPGREAR